MGPTKHGILVPYEITVPDGGSDGEWKAESATNDFIPRNWTRYQCKAEHITKGKCRDEIAPKNAKGERTVKARVKEILEAGGCYAFFSNGHEVKPSGDEDIDTIVRDQLQEVGVTPDNGAIIEFFGCNRIADWTNKFPAAVRYVREVTKGFGGSHFFTFDGWSKLKDVSGPFFGNDAIKEKIATVQETLLSLNSPIIRMTGLSGVGKSRLIYEALKPIRGGSVLQNSLSASCIYISYDSISTDLLGFIGHLADNGYAAIVVVDDCPPSIHDRIANIVLRSSLSAITIFHEPQQQRDDSRPLKLVPDEMGDVVEQILRGDVELLARGDGAVKAVASFAQGFPQIAKLIVEFHRTPTMDELNDRAKVFHKLLSRGDDPDSTTLLTAQALSLFRTIGGSAAKLEEDLKVIRELFCQDISEVEYRRSIHSQMKRRILQQIADTLILTPRPLAVALAADFISFFPPGNWKAVVDRLQEAGLLSEFRRRIEELEFSDQAEALGKMFLEVGLPFNDAEYLLTGTTGSQMFRALTMLSPSTAIKVAKGSLSSLSINALRDLKESRRDLLRALELLVWEPDTFQDAAELILKLAAAENEAWANNATGSFNQLFNLHLSGTKVPAIDRLRVAVSALESNEPEIRRIAVNALGAALNFQHFSRSGDATLGGKREAHLDWQPKSNREALEYWRECFSILRSQILEKEGEAEAAKNSLGKNIQVVLQTPLLLELEPELRRLIEHFNHLWPEVKDKIKSTLNNHDDLTEIHRKALLRCKLYLTPPEEDLVSKLQDLVGTPGWHHRHEEDGSFSDSSRDEAESFASELAAKQTDLVPYFTQLLTGEQQQGEAFGAVIGKESLQATELVETALDLWPKLDSKARNASFVSGLMRGLRDDSEFRSKTLDRIASDSQLTDLLIPLTVSIDKIREEDFIRIRDAVLGSRLESWRLESLIQGLRLQMLTIEFLVTEFSAILAAKPDSAKALFAVLFSHCQRDNEKFGKFSDLFQTLLLASGPTIGDSHFGWEWHEVALKLISKTSNVGWLQSVSQSICKSLLESKTWVGTNYLCIVVSKLFETAPAETWPPFGDALASGDDFEKFILSEFLGKSGSSFDNTSSPLWRLPVEQFQAWVRANPSIVPLILGKISLYTVEKQGSEVAVFNWHPHALILLKEGSNEEEMSKELMRNLFSFGSTGSRVPYLEKRLALIHMLSENGDAKLARIGRPVHEWLSKEIEQTKRAEMNEKARFD